MAQPQITEKQLATLPSGLDGLRILSARQGAELLGVSLATFRRLDWAGKLPPAIWLSDRRKGWSVGRLLAYAESRAAKAA